MKTIAIKIPIGVNATLMPSSASGAPSQPFCANNCVSATPATAVGSAKGMSTMASNSRRPGKRYRTRAQTRIVPITRLTQAGANESPNEILSALSVRRLVRISQNWAGESSSVLRKRPARGMRMMTESHVRVRPMVRPNPGKLLRRATAVLTNPPATPRPPPSRSVLVDLVEKAAVGEVVLLRLGPTTKNVVDGEKFDLGEGFFVFPCNLRIPRTIGVACGNFLTFLGIPIFQVGFGDGAGALLVGDLVDD